MARVKLCVLSLKEAFTQLFAYPGSEIFSNENSIQNNKNSKTIDEMINAVESGSRWLNIKEFRKSIEKIAIGIEIGINQNKVDHWIEIYYNLTKQVKRR